MSCCNQYKDTNLKAIHNTIVSVQFDLSVVAISTKIQIWKQFTTKAINYKWLVGCCNQYKDTVGVFTTDYYSIFYR